jgi:hypothetical protein
MFTQPRRSPRRPRSGFATLLLTVASLILCLLTLISKPAAAQSLVFTFGGDYNPFYSYNGGSAFDGTDYTDLPPILDLAALEGGTFTATFTVPAAPTPSSQTSTHATYDFSPASSIQFTLYDAAGQVKYQSSGSAAFTQGNVYRNAYRYPSFVSYEDQVVYTCLDGFTVSGVTPPPGTSDLGPISQFNFNISTTDVMGATHNYLSDLSFPTDPATYLNFTQRLFNVDVAYGDGDTVNGVGPYRFFNTSAYYTVNSVRVTSVVPEPGTLALFSIGGALVLRHCLRRRRLAR